MAALVAVPTQPKVFLFPVQEPLLYPFSWPGNLKTRTLGSLQEQLNGLHDIAER